MQLVRARAHSRHLGSVRAAGCPHQVPKTAKKERTKNQRRSRFSMFFSRPRVSDLVFCRSEGSPKYRKACLPVDSLSHPGRCNPVCVHGVAHHCTVIFSSWQIIDLPLFALARQTRFSSDGRMDWRKVSSSFSILAQFVSQKACSQELHACHVSRPTRLYKQKPQKNPQTEKQKVCRCSHRTLTCLGAWMHCHTEPWLPFLF